MLVDFLVDAVCVPIDEDFLDGAVVCDPDEAVFFVEVCALDVLLPLLPLNRLLEDASEASEALRFTPCRFSVF